MEDKERTNESIRQKILDFMEKVFNKFLVKVTNVSLKAVWALAVSVVIAREISFI